jgi:putative nucleotidyltransferase with HDIG domain
LAVFVSILLLSSTHLAVSVGTHRLHVIHVVFRGLYLLPIIAGALWFGARGGIMASLAVCVAYLGHILLSWPNQPMENVNQFAMMGVYVVVGAVSGILVDRQERERSRRLEAERLAQREAVVEGIASLANALGFRDVYTREHSERVSRLAVEIGKRRGLSDERLDCLRLASLMHDIGKIGVRDDILFKPDELTPEERARIERHPALAAEILRPIHGAEEIAGIVLSHHECPDGSGYPRGLRGDEIPPEARILRVADVFSALTDSRTYKTAMDASGALTWMLAKEGTKLDRESVRTLQTLVDDGKVGAALTNPDSTGRGVVANGATSFSEPECS